MSQGSRYKKVAHDRRRDRKGPQPRKNFDGSGGVICKGCFALKNENAILKDEIKRLKQKLKFRQDKSDQIANAHMPSSRIDYKENSKEENHLKKGGAKVGHKGHGRSACVVADADEVIDVSAPLTCVECLCNLNLKDTRERTVIESVPIVAKQVVYRLKRGVCPKCFKIYPSRAPVLPKSLYGNSLVAQAAVMHFVHGITIGKVLGIFGENVSFGGLMESFHRLAGLASSARELLINEYRLAKVKHADETGWRNDGRSGWAWLFATPDLSIFEFRDNRSARVPKEIFGEAKLSGVLVVDRYGAYNQVPVNIQYCYAHLLRDVTKLEEEFKDNLDVQDFCSRLGILLSNAMKLRNLKISEEEYLEKALDIQSSIEMMMQESHNQLGIRNIQDLFIDKRERLYHWAKSREVPAENNRAERELRPLVVARKVSFGSQSDAGAKTRASIMTLLHTAKKRLKEESLEEWLAKALNKIVEDPSINFATLIPPAIVNPH